MIDYDELEHELYLMGTRSRLFIIIKREMLKRGHWKNKPRGKANPDNLNKK